MVCINPNWAELKTRKMSKMNTKTGHMNIKGTYYLNFSKGNNHTFPVKCGKCIGCKLDHASEVACRIWMEAQEHEENCFLTLTYDQKHLPIAPTGYPTLNIVDVQSFLKRLRYYYPNIDIRYVVAGEYGPKTLRPHYHLALHGLIPDDLKEYKKNHQGDWIYDSAKIQKIWGNGIIKIGKLTQQSASYIARYVTKKILQEDHDRAGTVKEFIIYSKKPAIGLTNWLKHKEQYIKQGGIYIKVKDKVRLFPIPTLFQKKRREEIYDKYQLSKLHAPMFSYYDEEQQKTVTRPTSTKDVLQFQAQADFLYDCILAEPYYEEKKKNIELAQQRMKDLLQMTDLPYVEYLKVIENKLNQNAKLLKRTQI